MHYPDDEELDNIVRNIRSNQDETWKTFGQSADGFLVRFEQDRDQLWNRWEQNKDQLWSQLQEHKDALWKEIEEQREQWCREKPDPEPDPDPYEGFSGLSGWEIGFVDALNDFRGRLGVQKLAFDQFLIEESQGHSEAMADAIARGVPEDEAITERSFVNLEVGVTGHGGLYGDYSDRADINLGPWYLDIWVDRYIAETPQAVDSPQQGAGYLDYAFSVPEFRKAVFDPFYDKIGVGFAYYDDGDPNTFDGYLTILVGTDDTSLNL